MTQPHRIAIINQHTSNFGDDAAGVCLIYQLLDHFPLTTIEVIYKRKSTFGDALPINDPRVRHRTDLYLNENDLGAGIAYAILPRRLFEKFFSKSRVADHVRALQSTDVVFVSPCGANIGRYRDKLFLFRVLIATKECSKVLFSLNTIGRSGTLWYDYLAKTVLKKTLNFVREKKSYDDLHNWGISATLGVDTALSMPLKMIDQAKQECSLNGDYIAFIPTFALKNWHPDFKNNNLDDQFNSIYSCLASVAKRANFSILIIPHLHGTEDETGDLLVAVDELKRRGVCASIAEDVKSPISYAATLSMARIVVTMRYHGIVLAARTGRPFVGISYENKMHEVASYCHLPKQVINLRDLAYEELESLVIRTISESDTIAESLLHSRERLERLSRLPADWLASFGCQK
jgi:polysaccharide pyruvyl transferase WcaK-like protein